MLLNATALEADGLFFSRAGKFEPLVQGRAVGTRSSRWYKFEPLVPDKLTVFLTVFFEIYGSRNQKTVRLNGWR
jgi:hypothetical protein